MDMEDIVEKLSNHDNRLDNLEDYQNKQNGTLQDLDKRINKLIWGFVIGEGTIIVLLIQLLAR